MYKTEEPQNNISCSLQYTYSKDKDYTRICILRGDPQRFSAHELRLTETCSSPIVFGNRTLNKIYPLKYDNGPIWKPILVVNEGIFRNEDPVITQLQHYSDRKVLAQLVMFQTKRIFLTFF
jgi:hypothetical protein